MYAVEFETINQNGLIKIPKEYNTFKDNEPIRVIILKDTELSKYKKEVSDLINDYKKNGNKNFVDYEDGNKEIDNWLDSLDENKKII